MRRITAAYNSILTAVIHNCSSKGGLSLETSVGEEEKNQNHWTELQWEADC
jgi:hypothetical protein